MNLKLGTLNEDHVKEICNWKYPNEYSVYNFPEWSMVVSEKWDIGIQAKREKEFVAIINEENNLCGYIRFINNYDYILVGIGLKPSLCGQGFGKNIMKLLKDESEIRYGNKRISLEVRTFNKRAIKCYKKAGFKITDTYIKYTYIGYDEFFKMDYVSGILK